VREPDQRDVAEAGLELGKEALRYPARGLQLAARPAAVLALAPDAAADAAEQIHGKYIAALQLHDKH
jgi:hypothetical protein